MNNVRVDPTSLRYVISERKAQVGEQMTSLLLYFRVLFKHRAKRVILEQNFATC